VNITHLRRVVISDPDPVALADFYVGLWGLRRVAETKPESLHLAGSGSEHHVLCIRPGSQAAVIGYSLGVADQDAVDNAAAEVRTHGDATLLSEPDVLDQPGGGYGFSIVDPDGREIQISSDVAAAPPPDGDGRPPIRPSKISHLVLNSPNTDRYRDLLTSLFGFRVADETAHMVFLKCNLDHHSVALTRAPHASLNHIAFEVPTADDVLQGIKHMEAAGFETIWGPGRHPQGKNVFGYFLGPNRQVLEYTAEIEQIPDAQLAPRFWTPDDYEIYDEWADPSSLRPTDDTRSLMLGVAEEGSP
jgi:catechol 2,3-dioxygenase-like lactoylglutathione lyase family enzyme